MKRTVDTDTLTTMAAIADRWIAFTGNVLSPFAMIELLKADDPKGDIRLLRTILMDYCDQLETAVLNAQPVQESNGPVRPEAA